MEFTDRIRAIAQRVPSLVEHLATEEATKNALVMPFIAALGYDVFNPLEVVPEFTADVGTKRGEKVDYAIKRGDEVIILIETKRTGTNLDADQHATQLYRYFSVVKARIAILTDGVIYRFFSDLDAPNIMDRVPFLEIDLRDLREPLLARLEKLTKGAFDLDTMLSAANDLKYMAQIRTIFEQQIEAPDDELVRFFYLKANPSGRFVQAIREQFRRLVKLAVSQYVSDRVGARLRTALAQADAPLDRPMNPSVPVDASPDDAGVTEPDSGIVTTEEELDGFRIVRAIVCGVVPLDRVVHRDTKSYFGILVDDNNRKPICRLHFNRTQKYLGLIDEERKETRIPIEKVEDLYRFADELRAAALRHVAD